MNLTRLNRAADVLHVAPDKRERFADHIGTIVFNASIKHKLKTELSDVDDRARAAAKAVRSARTAVAKLSWRQKARLGTILTRPFAVSRGRAQLSQKRNGGPLILEPYDVMRQSLIGLICSLGMIPRHGWTLPWTSTLKIISLSL